MEDQPSSLINKPIFLWAVIPLMMGGILYLFRPVFFVLFILFGGILFAIFLTSIADFIQRTTNLPRKWSLGLTITVLFFSSIGCGWLTGSAFGSQISKLIRRLPEAVEIIESYLSNYPWGQNLLSFLPAPGELLPLGKGLLGNITGFFTTTVGVVAGLLFVFVIGVYLSVEPEVYLGGLLRLFPADRRDRVREILVFIGRALRWWLIGRAVAMAAVGLLTVLLLWLIGLSLAPALGLIAGLLTFVPFIGPILAAVPAILVALVEGPYMVLYVVLIYVLLQQLENQILTPLIQKRAIFLPPAVLLTAQLLIGVLFGYMGVLLASPLAIVFVILIQTLYVEDSLGESVKILGAHDSLKKSKTEE